MIYIKKATFKRDYEPFKIGHIIDFKAITLLVGDQGAGKSTLINLMNSAKNKEIINDKVAEIVSDNPNASLKVQKELGDVRFMQDKSVVTVDVKGKVISTNSGGLFDTYSDVVEFDYIPEFHLNVRYLDTEAHNPRINYQEYNSKRPILQELSGICKNIHRLVDMKNKDIVAQLFQEYVNRANAHNHDINGAIINSHRSHGETILPMLKELASLKNHVILLDEPETSLSIRSQYKIVEIIREIEANGNQLIVATHSPIIMQAIGEVLSLEHNAWMKAYEFIETQK